jgi:putative membrane protein
MKPKKLTGPVFAGIFCAGLSSVCTFAVAADAAAAKVAPVQHQQAAAQKSAVAAPQDNPAKEKLKDNTFVAQAAISGMAEVEISKLAASKASDQKLRKYATATVKDQSANNIKLWQLAAQNRLDLPRQLDKENAGLINNLKSLSGAEFDKAYINSMKKTQDTKVALFDNAAGEPTLNVELRVFANQTLPALRTRQENTHALPALM